MTPGRMCSLPVRPGGSAGALPQRSRRRADRLTDPAIARRTRSAPDGDEAGSRTAPSVTAAGVPGGAAAGAGWRPGSVDRCGRSGPRPVSIAGVSKIAYVTATVFRLQWRHGRSASLRGSRWTRNRRERPRSTADAERPLRPQLLQAYAASPPDRRDYTHVKERPEAIDDGCCRSMYADAPETRGCSSDRQ
jgi:hypothetical protein